MQALNVSFLRIQQNLYNESMAIFTLSDLHQGRNVGLIYQSSGVTIHFPANLTFAPPEIFSSTGIGLNPLSTRGDRLTLTGSRFWAPLDATEVYLLLLLSRPSVDSTVCTLISYRDAPLSCGRSIKLKSTDFAANATQLDIDMPAGVGRYFFALVYHTHRETHLVNGHEIVWQYGGMTASAPFNAQSNTMYGYAYPIITHLTGCLDLFPRTLNCSMEGGHTITIHGDNFGPPSDYPDPGLYRVYMLPMTPTPPPYYFTGVKIVSQTMITAVLPPIPIPAPRAHVVLAIATHSVSVSYIG